jgi:PAS domain S-box-containing protein
MGTAEREFSLKPSFKIVAWLAGASFLVVLGVSLSLWTFRQIEQTAAVRQHSNAVIGSATGFLSSLKDVETGQRGYLLTGDEGYLEPYLAERKNVKKYLQELQQSTLLDEARKHLDALPPLVDARLALMAESIEMFHDKNVTGALDVVRSGRGKQLMDSIRTEMGRFIVLEQDLLAQREAEFQSDMHRMFAFIVASSIFTLLFALAFAWLLYRETQLRFKSLIHLETQRSLEFQEAMNVQLKEANVTLRASEQSLSVTLSSIGDAVIATDAEARVTRLNPVAQQLTGWTQDEAFGRPVSEIFNIISQETRQPSAIPVMETLAHGTVQGLANHTVLIARDGCEKSIADSCAPIRDRDGQVVGAVLVFRDVTEEYLSQQALRDSSALVQAILNTVVDGIVTIHARGGIVETVNPATERMFGYSAAELKGQDFSLLIPELDRDQPNGSLAYYSASEEARASGLGREVIGRRKDGTTFPLEIAVSEMWLGGQSYFTGILRDITTRKQVEEALIKAGALQSAIFNSANFSSIATDAKGVIQIFNVGAEHMLGYTAAEVVDTIKPSDISDPQEVIARAESLSAELDTPIAPGFEALVFKASRGIEDIYELTYIRKDGSRFPAVVSVTALRDPQNTIIGYLLIGTDNTARRRVEAERAVLDQALQDKNVELESAKVTAEKANLAKSDFLSSMSHELRTPLSAILGFAQLIESGLPQPTPTQRRSVDQILKAGWYLLELINEILDLALIESGKLSMSLEPVSLAEVMRECETMIEPQAQQRGISVAFTHFEKPCFVKADRTRVKQVLINLLSNAIKYNKVGGTVAVETAVSVDTIRISVRDTGEGLSPELLDQLFQPFNRLGQESNAEQGTGIGLVVSKRLVEWMGGVIGVESTVGQGSVFWIELNLTSAPQFGLHADELTLISEAREAGDAPLQSLLYIEDNPANLMLVEDIIARRPDIHLLSARDGNRGIEIARAAQPDVILMDINLPGISGIEALAILLADPATAHIPVIALSANAIPRDIERGLEAGFFRYLTKPIKVVEFMDTLDVTMKFAKAEAAHSAEMKKEVKT